MKYSLTKNKKVVNGIILFQIKAEMSFDEVAKDELGGWIEKEENLSQEGNAWVYENAHVYGNARVYGNAWLYGGAWVYGNAQVSENARVYGNAQVYGNALVSGDALVHGDAWVFGDAWVYGKLNLSLGYFFGWKEKKEEIKCFDNDDYNQLIGKGVCKVEYGDDEDKEVSDAIALLERKGKIKDGKIIV